MTWLNRCQIFCSVLFSTAQAAAHGAAATPPAKKFKLTEAGGVNDE